MRRRDRKKRRHFPAGAPVPDHKPSALLQNGPAENQQTAPLQHHSSVRIDRQRGIRKAPGFQIAPLFCGSVPDGGWRGNSSGSAASACVQTFSFSQPALLQQGYQRPRWSCAGPARRVGFPPSAKPAAPAPPPRQCRGRGARATPPTRFLASGRTPAPAQRQNRLPGRRPKRE